MAKKLLQKVLQRPIIELGQRTGVGVKNGRHVTTGSAFACLPGHSVGPQIIHVNYSYNSTTHILTVRWGSSVPVDWLGIQILTDEKASDPPSFTKLNAKQTSFVTSLGSSGHIGDIEVAGYAASISRITRPARSG